MQQSSRPVVFLGVGIALAVLAGLIVFLGYQQAQSSAPDPYKDTTPVVVAKVDIPERTVITGEMIETRPYPLLLVPAAAVKSVDVAVQKTTIVAIPAGAPIVTGQLVTGGGTTGVSLTIEKGKVRVAFPVSDALTAADQIRPGDRVDILATIPGAAVVQAAAAPAPAASPSPGASPPPPALVPAQAQALPAVTQTVVQNLAVVTVIGKNILAFDVDHQTALVLKNLRDSGVIIDIVIRSRAETDAVKTTPVDSGYVVRTFGFRQ